MGERLQRVLRRWRRGAWLLVLLPVASTGVLTLRPVHEVLTGFENGLYDARLRALRQPVERSRDLIIVTVDDLAIQGIRSNPTYAAAYGNWPYSRNLWAPVFERLMDDGARAVVMDFTMDEASTDPGVDQQLAAEVRERHVPLYVAFAVNAARGAGMELPQVEAVNLPPNSPAPVSLHSESHQVEDEFGDSPDADLAALKPEDIARALAFPVVRKGLQPTLLREGARTQHPVPPVAALLPVASGFGLALTEEDSDGIMRRARFAYSDGVNSYVTLSLAVAADLLGARTVELSPGRLQMGSRSLAINRDGDALLDYRGDLFQRFETRSLLYLLDDWNLTQARKPPRLPPGTFKDKVVLIAGFAVGTHDWKATPFAAGTPGVVKQAVELEALLSGRFILDAPFWLDLLMILGTALLTAALILGSSSTILEMAWLPGMGLTLFFGTGLWLVQGKLHVGLAAPALLLVGIATITFNHLFARSEGRQVKAMFSRYVAKQVVDQLVRHPERLKLDGENLEITAFFSDIRGFSTFSEQFRNDPKGLVTLLNTYLTRVSGTLQKHGACLDKYIGDAVVCIFGAPLPLADHAVRACRAALEVQAEISQLRTEFAAQGLPDVYTRVGMNSAVMFVGNFGSEQLFNYTAMGDGMNLASRLEGANKAYDSLIAIGPRTYQLARDFIEVRELDKARVAGKTEAITLYELLCLKGALSPQKATAVAAYGEALRLFRSGRFGEAAEVLEQSLKLLPEDGPSAKLLKRCRHYQAEPPPVPFDGITNLEK